ncbi:MAG TPA: hypothetical protein VJP77_09265 [Planctomycetota bacterium]|nr:hypothetical protein [Planctomycetota bacterium]
MPAVPAQGPAFDSPGQAPYSTLGQTTRFSTEFNPALGFVLDFFGDWKDVDPGAGAPSEDGFDLQARLLELNAAAYVDPSLWAYVALVSESFEAPEVEEAAGEYIGFENNATVKAGRFFVDFGKQMQHHAEELRTLERPLVLREYLGEELAGTGVQGDYWLPLGDATPLRFSLAAFGDLVGEPEEDADPFAEAKALKELGELSFTARVTGMTELSEHATVQLGASARLLPEFAFVESGGDAEDGLSNTVYGADLTFGHVDDTGLRRWTVGGEWLLSTGDQSATYDAGLLQFDVFDDDLSGWLAFADYAWSAHHSAGVQASFAELPAGPGLDAAEYDAYYTWLPTEFRRMRFGVTVGDSDADGDALRVYVQFTLFFGSHAHGINW